MKFVGRLDRFGQFDSKLVGHHAGDLIDARQRNPQRSPDVLDRGAGLHRSEGADLGDAVFAVFFFYVVDNFAAPLLAKVDVDIGSFQAVLIKESLEQQIVLQRASVTEVQRVANDRADARTTNGRRNVHRPGFVNEVPANQKVVGKTEFVDHAQLSIEPCLNFFGQYAVGATVGFTSL